MYSPLKGALKVDTGNTHSAYGGIVMLSTVKTVLVKLEYRVMEATTSPP
jgi:hypothetical protein